LQNNELINTKYKGIYSTTCDKNNEKFHLLQCVTNVGKSRKEGNNLTLKTLNLIPSAICWHYYELTIFSTLAG